jgi:hypothetical protein
VSDEHHQFARETAGTGMKVRADPTELITGRAALAGLTRAGVERDDADQPTGRLWRMDRWLAGRVPAAADDLGALSRKALSFEITGYTDATPGATADDLEFLARAAIAQRLHCMPPAEVCPPEAITAEPVKIMLDDTTLPPLGDLAEQIRGAHDVAAGSDAPFGDQDPWRVMRAAVRRPGLFRAEEAVSPARALALFLGEPAAPGAQRLVARGRPANLALLRAGPREALDCLASDLVAVTFIGGAVAYARG